VADKSSQLVLTALTRAAADTAGVPLIGTRTTSGLFPNTTLGKQAAQRCRDDGYLGEAENACTITDKGMTYLLGQVSPRQVLEDFVRVLESREGQVGELLEAARHMQASIDTLRGTVTTVLDRLAAPGGDLKSLFSAFREQPETKTAIDPVTAVREMLTRWKTSGATEDCALPDLYRRLAATCPGLTIGAFHDVLRKMHDDREVYLHPWTGPLYAIPQPSFALMVGHEIDYYTSLRDESAAA
jgi:hypothetical protein